MKDAPPGLASQCVLTSAAHLNEVMVVLGWDSDRAVPGGSDYARSLAHRLKAHGMVSRSEWKCRLSWERTGP